jgi:hypothetical protein
VAADLRRFYNALMGGGALARPFIAIFAAISFDIKSRKSHSTVSTMTTATSIAITGATGQLGRLVVAALKRRVAPEQLLALVHTPAKAGDLGIAARATDYDRPDTLPAALAGVQTLLLISSSEVGQREEQHRNVIDAARTAGVGRIVYTSLLRADVSTLSLAGEHRATEAMLKAVASPGRCCATAGTPRITPAPSPAPWPAARSSAAPARGASHRPRAPTTPRPRPWC